MLVVAWETVLLTTLTLLLGAWREAAAFYLPGAPPHDYELNEKVDIFAKALTSTETQLSYSYYSLPYCEPEGGGLDRGENLGEVLSGENIVSTPFKVKFMEKRSCTVLCGRAMTEDDLGKFREYVHNNYIVNLMSDNLPAGVYHEYIKVTNNGEINSVNEEPVTLLERGFPVGFFVEEYRKNVEGQFKNNYHLNNHLSITFSVNNEARIVKFMVKPYSVRHQYDAKKFKAGDPSSTPLHSCNRRKSPSEDEMPAQVLHLEGDETDLPIFFTYEVDWIREDIAWSDRWLVYLETSSPDARIHWFHIIVSILIVLLLTGITAIILLSILRKDIREYNDPDLEEDKAETGWKLVHGNVFRPPCNSMLLSVVAGSGLQIFAVTTVLLTLGSLGVLSPSMGGSVATAIIVVFMLSGTVAGYFGARIYKVMGGTNYKLNAVLTATFFPGLCYGLVFIVNLFVWTTGSTLAIPVTTMIVMLILYVGLCVPLTFVGTFYGTKQPTIELPVRTDQLPREIPAQPWWSHNYIVALLTGSMPFACVFVEYFFILSAIWLHQIYYVFGFLIAVLFIVAIACAEVAIVVVYFKLVSEDYHWWWRSFICTASSGFYFFGYAIIYYATALEVTLFVSSMYYFVYMFLATVAFSLLTGAIGFLSAFMFVRTIYAAIKVD